MITWSVDVLLGGSQVTPARCTQLTANAKYIWLSGKNGAGKSTLLDSITGVGDRPVQGSWRMSRADTVLAQPGLYHNIAYVSQRFDLVPQWSVVKSIRRTAHVGDDEQRRIVDALGLTGLSSRRCKSLSVGEAKRVSLARALASKRPLLFLDECFMALDTEVAERALDLIESIDSIEGVLSVDHAERVDATAHHCWKV